MQSLFSRPFGKLDADDLRDLVEVRKVREYIQLEYKDKLPSHGHTDTVEFLADVTAMANAQGGHILIGVEEEKGQPDGTPKSLIGIGDGDTQANWIQSVCLSSIDEKIPGLQVRDVPIANGLSCVVISIPNSVRKPHMVVHEKHRSFRMRHGREKSPMGMQEVRNMILSMNTYRASLAEFLAERKRVLKEEANGEPWLLLMATPIYVDGEKLDPLRDDIRDVLEKASDNPDRNSFPSGISAGKPQPRIYGVKATNENLILDRKYRKYFRLFRNGHLEYCANFISRGVPDDWPKNPMKMYSYEMAVTLLHFLEIAKQVMHLAEVSEPIAITGHWENFNPSYLYRWRRQQDALLLSSNQPFIWHQASLDLELVVPDLSDPSGSARLIINRLFNTFGYEDNPYFGAEGQFLVWK